MIDIYLASPYSHEDPYIRSKRYHQALEATAYYLKQGLTIFSPIAYAHNIHVTHFPFHDSEGWLRLDLAFLPHCKLLYILMLDGWEESKGIKREIDEAEKLGIPIVYAQPRSIGVKA